MMLRLLNWEYSAKRWAFVDTNYGWYFEGAILLFVVLWFAWQVSRDPYRARAAEKKGKG